MFFLTFDDEANGICCKQVESRNCVYGDPFEVYPVTWSYHYDFVEACM